MFGNGHNGRVENNVVPSIIICMLSLVIFVYFAGCGVCLNSEIEESMNVQLYSLEVLYLMVDECIFRSNFYHNPTIILLLKFVCIHICRVSFAN